MFRAGKTPLLGKLRLRLAHAIAKRFPAFVARQYHLWYYNSEVWKETHFLGVPIQKSILDLWLYQEVIWRLNACLVVEFGTMHGGSALFFSRILQAMGRRYRVLTVDVDHSNAREPTRSDPNIEMMTLSSADPAVAERIRALREDYEGPVFFILDSDHSMRHVLAELENIRGVTRPGDYVIVEDSNLNGHPVWPGYGPGPLEAIREYVGRYPDDYERDLATERKFLYTWAPEGFLIRR